MKIAQTFQVHSPIAAVWDLLQDIPTVAQCLPGTELTESCGADHHRGTVAVAVGPMTVTFEGEADITTDPGSYRGRISGKGTDRRGGNRGQLIMDYCLSPIEQDTTSVAIDVEVDLSGPVAKFGRTGLMIEIATRLIGEFASCLDAKLAARTPAEADAVTARNIGGISLFFASLFAGAARWFRRVFRRGENKLEEG